MDPEEWRKGLDEGASDILCTWAPGCIASWPRFKFRLECMTLITLNHLSHSGCLWPFLTNDEFLQEAKPWYGCKSKTATKNMKQGETVWELTSTALVAAFLSSSCVTRPTHTYISAPQSSKKHLVFSRTAFVRAMSSNFNWPSLILQGEKLTA